MKHLVLGSSGQIGSSLTNYLRKVKKEEVLEFDIQNEEYQDLRLNRNILLEQYISDCDIVHFLAYDVGGATLGLTNVESANSGYVSGASTTKTLATVSMAF